VRAPYSRKSEIRDPVHGSIPMDSGERKVLDHPFVQRLRGIRQLGFTQYPFPGATHSRFMHSVGVMNLAGKAFESIFCDKPFSSPERSRQLCYCLRIAGLLHDLGHGPFSHAAEFAMPPARDLGIENSKHWRASHEDYTVAILTNSSLSSLIEREFGFTGRHVAALIDPRISPGDDFFEDEGFDLRGILSQVISSNLDADRLDYLVRDSYFTGARYGQVDVFWLIKHLGRHVGSTGRLSLSLDRTALYAFENFLLARFHMFLMVYFHRKSVSYELMLQQYMRDPACDYSLPSDLDEYIYVDDAHLWMHLSGSEHPFARRIVERRPYKVVFERHGEPEKVDLYTRQRALEEAGIHVIPHANMGVAYSPVKEGKSPIFLMGSNLEGALQDKSLSSTDFRLAHAEACISRLYVPAESLDTAREVMAGMGVTSEQQQLGLGS
jgi:uncharacterized protein